MSNRIEDIDPDFGKENDKNKEEEKGQKVIRRSFYEDAEGLLYEEVMHKEFGLCFARYHPLTEMVTYVKEIQLDGNIIVQPIDDELIRKGAVLLPTEVEDFGSIGEFLSEIEKFIIKYCDISPEFVNFAKWYVLLTAVFDKLNTVPYLRFLGDTGTGKSRGVDIIGRICYKPMLATACITPAPIYRLINIWGGTLILEEADMKQSDTTNEVVKILNAGFERGKPVLRSTKDNPDSIQVLPVFCPKIFATRRRFDDAALEARCLTETMSETRRKDIPSLLPARCFEEQQRIRNKLLMFRFKYRKSINTDAVLGIDFGNLEPRLKQVAASFAVVFANFLNVLAEFKQMMAQYQKELIEHRSLSFEGQVVEALVECLKVYVTNETNVTYVTLTAANIADEMPKYRGQPQDSRTVGKALRTLGLSTQSRKVEGKAKRVITLDKDKLLPLVNRYVPMEEQEEAVTLVTNVTSVTKTEEEAIKEDVVTSVTKVTSVTSDCNAKLKSIFDELAASSKGGLVSKERLDSTAALSSISSETVEAWLAEQKKAGNLFEPKFGQLTFVT